MRRGLPHPILTLSLMGLWLLLVNSVTPGQIVLGAILGLVIPLFTSRFWPDQVRMRKPFTLLRFVGMVLWDIAIANLIVARLILGRPQALRPAFVAVPLILTSDLAISLLASTITLTPGTLSAQLSAERKILWVHALDVADSAELVATIKQRYEKPLQEVFEAC